MEKVGIENILKVTGLSCDDLINKLLLYKTSRTYDDTIDLIDDVQGTIDMLQQDAKSRAIKNVPNLADEVSTLQEISVVKPLVVDISARGESKNASIIKPSTSAKDTSEIQKPICLLDSSDERTDSSGEETTEEIRNAIKEQIRLLRSKKTKPLFELPNYNFDILTTHKRKRTPPRYRERQQYLSTSQTVLQDTTPGNSKGNTVCPKIQSVLINNESDIKIVNVSSVNEVIVLDDDDDDVNEKKVKAKNIEMRPKNMKMSDILLERFKSKDKAEEVIVIEENEDKLDVIKPTKTSDIKKIKGWRYKLFNVPNEPKHPERDLNAKKIKAKVTESDVKVNPFYCQALDRFLSEIELDNSFNISTIKNEDDGKTILKKPVVVKSEKANNTSTKYIRKPRTVAEKRRIEEMRKKEITKPRPKCERNSFLHYNGEKLKISSVNPIKHININEIIKKKIKKKKRVRDTSFKSIKANNNYLPILQFNPGPLSKKASLQVSHQDKFKTVIKELPPVYLEVKPELGKRMHPNIEPHVQFKTYIMDEDRVDFALSVLKEDNKVEDNFFKFPVPYAYNQKLIKLYKKIYVMPIEQELIKKDSGCFNDVIQNIVDDMLNYVTLKEMSDTLIKEDQDLNDFKIGQTVETVDDKPVGNFEVISNKKPPKSSKTSLELKRLNVKVIEVDIEQDTDNCNTTCKKLSCQLGCVCKSLNGFHHPKDHCGNIDCMFKCNCNYLPNNQFKIASASKIILPAGTNLFSNGTVNELENRAKRDLARVEKEFTQTVIQSNNQTIMVGNNLERKKRITKAPKKLQDFINPNRLYMEMKKLYKINECCIKLTKTDLNHLIPFCMIHEVYNCECLTKKKQEVGGTDRTTKKLTKIASKRKLAKSSNYNSVISTEEVTLFQPISSTISVSSSNTDALITDDPDEPNKKKRKQTFKGLRTSPIFIEETKEPALQRRKKPTREIMQNNAGNIFFKHIALHPKFVLNSDDFYAAGLKRILIKKYTDLRQFRMIPWKYFSENYYKNNVVLWCHMSNSGKILITPNAIPPRADMINIKSRTDLTFSLDFLSWLKTGKLPPDKDPNNLHVVLVSTDIKKCWEIFGISCISRNERSRLSTNTNNYTVETSLYSKLKLYTADKEDKTIDLVSLPSSSDCVKWKKIRLKSNFSILRLKRYQFNVKYNVLLQMAKEAFKSRTTKILFFPTCVSNSDVKYGLYAVPEYNDCIFVGPYQIYEEEDFETLRYVNRELVNTDMFDKMLNRKSESKSCWLYTNVIFTYMFKSILKVNQSPQLKSLSNNDSNTRSDTHFEFGKEMNKASLLNRITALLNKGIKSYNENLDSHNKKPKYIMSLNVPTLGYVQAYSSDNSSFIICWPENDKPKVFSSEVTGLQWLKRYMETFLTPLPLTFNTKLIVVNNKPANLTELKLANLKCFPFIGKLGILNDIDEASKNIFISQKLFTVAELNLSIQHRDQNILLLECCQIFNELSISQNMKFATVNDFADCLISLLHKETSENLKNIKERRVLLKRKHELELKLKKSTNNLKHTLLIKKNYISNLSKDKQRSNNALNRLKANDEIHIESVDSINKDKLKFNNNANKTEECSEIICLDSDDDATVTITSPVKNRTRTFVPLTAITKSSLLAVNKKRKRITMESTIKPYFASNTKPTTIESTNGKLFNKNTMSVQNGNNAKNNVGKLTEKKLDKSNKMPSLIAQNNISPKKLKPNVLRKIDKIFIPLGSDDKHSKKKEYRDVLYKAAVIGDKTVNLKLYPNKK